MKIILREWSELPLPAKIEYMVVPTLDRDSLKAAFIVFFCSPLLVTFWMCLGFILWPFILHLWFPILWLVVFDRWLQSRTIRDQR